MFFKQISNKLRRIDAYPKPLEDFSVKTIEGATVTIISWIIILILIWSEVADYMMLKLKEELFVDTSRSSNLQINLDIIVHSISCDFLALDAMDSSGEQHLRIEHNIYKRRLDLQGQPIEAAKKEDITNTTLKGNEVALASTTEKIACGSCYGAEFNKSQCCNTCEDVKEAYRIRRWSFTTDNIEQCKSEHYAEKLKTAFTEGCQIYGSLEVNRVGGSFHIAPGQSFSISHVHVHDVQPFSSSSFNTSHHIKHLSFGRSIHNSVTNTLGGHNVWTEEGATMFQYYVKIIPTAYAHKNRTIIYSNQYSVTKHQKSVHVLSGETGMPGIFFSYELSPFMVKKTETTRSFGHLLTNICGIIGGVYTVAGITAALLYQSRKALEKLELGKSS